MINPRRLLDDLKRLLRRLEADLRERAGTVAELAELLQREYRAAREAGRTGESFEMWRDGTLTQAAAAWLLGCVFVRFLEDNGLVEEALLSGPQERRRLAAERQMQYFQRRPTDSDRDYLYDVFRTVQRLPAVTTLFDAQHNPIWTYGISGDAAKELIAFWRQVVPGTAERELVQRTLDAVYGVDINPYAVAIARFRLLVAALQASKLTTLRHAPGFRLNVAVGDSLLHGRRFDELDLKGEIQ